MAGVYISYPFCVQKCTYCNFASGVFPQTLQREYLSALRAEIERHAWAWTPETVYLGGGTPSQMEAGDLDRLLSLIPGAPWREATLEAAPGRLTIEQMEDWRRAGIGRVSLGVQTFVPKEIARTGRKHTPERVAEEIALLRKTGLGNINIDLIAGLSGQTAASWRESLDWIERLEPPHVSVYMLEVDEDSRLGLELLQEGSRYGARDVPSDEAIADFYNLAVDRLAVLGLRRYEISNFAVPGAESLHNLKYWRLEPYAGFGADAHSFDGRTRRQNVESPKEYVNRWRRGETECIEETAARPDEERFFVGLRLLEGIRPAPEEWRRWAAPIERFLAAGLLERDGERLRLSRQGVLLSNEVFKEFVIL